MRMCGATRRLKVIYDSKEDAEMALLEARDGQRHGRGSGYRKSEKRVYACPSCLGWHLTSWA